MQAIIDFLVKRLKMSEEDAVVAALFAIGGFTFDALLFPAGMPPLTVTILSGGSGLLLSKFVKSHPLLQNRVLARLDRLVDQGHLNKEDAEKYKQKLIAYWLESKTGIAADPQHTPSNPN